MGSSTSQSVHISGFVRWDLDGDRGLFLGRGAPLRNDFSCRSSQRVCTPHSLGSVSPPSRDAQPNLFPGRKTSTLSVQQVTELFLNVPSSKAI